MIPVSEASAIIDAHSIPLLHELVPLGQAIGRIMAEEAFADRDFPPFHRVAMDGIAIDIEAFEQGQRTFTIEGLQPAGAAPNTLQNNKACFEVMTGAILPPGANAVIRYEDIEITNKLANVLIKEVMPRQNIHTKGKDVRQGERLLKAGQKISPAEVALLASIGKSEVKVYNLPSVAIVSTGDELVDVEGEPLPYQIRRSNDAALIAAFHEMRFQAKAFHVPDSEQDIKEKVRQIMDDYPLIIFSGGVSKGKFDFIPTTLASLNVEKLFHRVNQRPGKPFWFGRNDTNTVFGLPGNPVSTYLCFYKYIKPWLLRMMGVEQPEQKVTLADDYTFAPSMTYFLQVKVQNNEGRLLAFPQTGGGSGDFANLSAIDGFIELPAENTRFKAGAVFSYIPFRT